MSSFPTKILLATDGSSHAGLARATAVDMANSVDSELHVVTVAPGYLSYDVNTSRKWSINSASRRRRLSRPRLRR
jgi:hypothetical protein